MNDEWEVVELHRADRPDAKFEGRLLAEADSRDENRANARRSSDRWTELAIYETRSGDWVAISVACSDKPGEVDFGEAVILTATEPHMRWLDAMHFWKWSWLAKKLADSAGWDVAERITPMP